MTINIADDPFIARFMAEGFDKGLTAGRAKGHTEGRAQEARKILLCLIQARGLGLSDLTRETVGSTTDIQVLEFWLERAATAVSADQIFAGSPGSTAAA